MAMVAILLACGIVLSRFFSIETPITKVSFSFLPLFIAARYFGTKSAMIVGGMGDLIGALLFPFGVYFPGYTLVETLRGFIFGKFLTEKTNLSRIIISVLITQILCSLVLNCLCMTIFYDSFRAFSFEKYLYFVAMRIPQVILMTVVQIAVSMPLLLKADKIFKKVLTKNN